VEVDTVKKEQTQQSIVDVSIFDPRYPDEDTRPADWQGGFNLTWVAGCGFGLLGVTFHADGRITIDTECMGRRFASAVFRYILSNAEYDVPAEDDEPLDGWQPLTDDIELTSHTLVWRRKPSAPQGGYPLLPDMVSDRHAVDKDGVRIFSHYRVVRGPEGS